MEFADHVECNQCQRQYPVIGEIADLRIDAPAWINFEGDRKKALAIDECVKSQGLEAAILGVFRNSRHFCLEKSLYRVRQVFARIDKCRADLEGWLKPSVDEQGVVLEIGCGPGQLIAAAAQQGRNIAGVDVSLEWLMIAKHLIRESGGKANLAAGLAEHLPVKSNTARSIISLDVIEHVGDQTAYVREISRALAPGGQFALVTPNRFSMSPEPHVEVWGVGYLPESLQAKWVKMVSGKDYKFTRLLSVSQTKNLFTKTCDLSTDVSFPPIPEADLAIFSNLKAKLALSYNALISSPLVKPFLPFFGAYYRITGTKN